MRDHVSPFSPNEIAIFINRNLYSRDTQCHSGEVAALCLVVARRVVAGTVISLIILAFSTGSRAYNLLGGKWSSANPLKYYNDRDVDGTITVYVNWANAARSWNSVSTKIYFQSTTFTNKKVFLSWDNDCSLGWDGLTQLYPSPTANPYTGANAYVNRCYTDGYSDQERQSVMAHELGHVLGLAHSTGAVLMNGYTCGDNSRWCTCGIYTPQNDDKNGAIAIYGS